MSHVDSIDHRAIDDHGPRTRKQSSYYVWIHANNMHCIGISQGIYRMRVNFTLHIPSFWQYILRCIATMYVYEYTQPKMRSKSCENVCFFFVFFIINFFRERYSLALPLPDCHVILIRRSYDNLIATKRSSKCRLKHFIWWADDRATHCVCDCSCVINSWIHTNVCMFTFGQCAHCTHNHFSIHITFKLKLCMNLLHPMNWNKTIIRSFDP